MFREFFCCKQYALIAWFGLCVTVSHSLFGAWVSARINTWYGDFYSTLQKSGGDLGSGEDYQSAHEVKAQLIQFCWIVAPVVVVHPLSRYIRSRWALAWRMALVRYYVANWDPDAKSIAKELRMVDRPVSTDRASLDVSSCTR